MNVNADALAKLALTRDAELLDAVSMEFLTEPSIMIYHVGLTRFTMSVLDQRGNCYLVLTTSVLDRRGRCLTYQVMRLHVGQLADVVSFSRHS